MKKKKLTLDQVKVESFITTIPDLSKKTINTGAAQVAGLWDSWFACWFSLDCDEDKPNTGTDCPFTQQPLILACQNTDGRNLSQVEPYWCENIG